MIDQNFTHGKWNELKGSLQKAWGKITSDELDQSEGDITRIAGVIQQKYGLGEDEARQKIIQVLQQFGEPISSENLEFHPKEPL